MKKKVLYDPVLLIFFNRPALAKKLIKKVNKYYFKKIYIFADGPRNNNQNDDHLCSSVRKIIENTKWKSSVYLRFNKKNYGCALNVALAIKFFFSKVSKGQVLEDDCIPTKNFFDFTKYFLEKYKYKKNTIGAISGVNRSLFAKNDSVYLSKFFGVWGWASWSNKINRYKLKPKYSIKDFNILNNFLGSAYIAKKIFYKAINGFSVFNTWDYQMSFFFQKNKLYILKPGVDLVKNLGQSGHSHKKLYVKNNFLKQKKINFKLLDLHYKFYNDLFYYFTEFKLFNYFIKISKLFIRKNN
jgi:hypothetical protein